MVIVWNNKTIYRERRFVHRMFHLHLFLAILDDRLIAKIIVIKIIIKVKSAMLVKNFYIPAIYNVTILVSCFVMQAAFLLTAEKLMAQPYLDIVTVKATISPDAGSGQSSKVPVQYTQYIAGALYPIKLKDSSKIIIGLYNEGWNFKARDIDGISNELQGLLIPLGFIKPLPGKWSIAATIIPRWNGEAGNLFTNSFQLGGSLIAACKKTKDLTFRVGAYYNSEFFGPFIIPLVGIDWQITKKDNLFGLLPQLLTYEHKVTNKFYWGAVYRMYNNTYRTGNDDANNLPAFIRINEMQLLLSADLYLAKKLVLNIEGGHSVFRKIRMGNDDAKKHYYQEDAVNNGFVFKAGLLYRVRLR